MLEFGEIEEVAFQSFGVRVDLFHLVLELLKRCLIIIIIIIIIYFLLCTAFEKNYPLLFSCLTLRKLE